MTTVTTTITATTTSASATCMTKSVTHANNDDPGKPCVFPFKTGFSFQDFNVCTHGIAGPWCATEVDETGLAIKYGFCNSSCPGGVFVGPSDVSGTCTLGSSLVSKTVEVSAGVSATVENCCCGDENCCWANCTIETPPDSCLPPGSEWKWNNALEYFEAVASTTSTPTDCNSPSDYTYNNITGKYYKAVNVKKKWADARDSCATEGANHIEFRTKEDFQVLEAIRKGKGLMKEI